MPIIRYENCPSIAPVCENKEKNVQAEFYPENEELELVIEVEEYDWHGSSMSDKYFYLPKEEALELARFILEQYGE